jgi:hypothetical protein
MEQNSSCEAGSRSASQEIPCLFLKVHYCVHKNPPLTPILSQLKPAHTLPSYFSKIHSFKIFLPTPMLSKWSLSFSFLVHHVLCIHLPMRVTCSAHLDFLDSITLIIYEALHHSFFLHSFNSSLLSPSIPLSTQFLNAFYVLPLL